MKPEIGTTLYYYTIRKGDFAVHKGMVLADRRGWYRKVAFETRSDKVVCPETYEIGVIQTGGPSIWLFERDDHKAAMMFHEYELGKLAKLEADVEKKKALIKTLESVGMESV